MKLKLFLILIFTQIVIIIFIGIIIYKKLPTNTASVAGISIDKKDVILEKDSLNYFYQLIPNSNRSDNVPWVSQSDAIYQHINNDGFNSIIEYNIKKEKNVYRIITIGDSFTFGALVKTEDNYPSKLESILNDNFECVNYNKFEVINLGVPGYDLQYSLERTKIKGLKYNPDLVVLFIKDDDLNQLNETMLPKVFGYQKQMERSGELEKELKNGDIYPYWTKAIKDTYSTISQDKITNIQLKYMELLRSSYKDNLLIMTFPFTKPNYINLLKNFTKNNKKTFLFDNLTNIYLDKNNFYQDSHPTVKGHQIIAKDLFNYLVKNKIIPCR